MFDHTDTRPILRTPNGMFGVTDGFDILIANPPLCVNKKESLWS